MFLKHRHTHTQQGRSSNQIHEYIFEIKLKENINDRSPVVRNVKCLKINFRWIFCSSCRIVWECSVRYNVCECMCELYTWCSTNFHSKKHWIRLIKIFFRIFVCYCSCLFLQIFLIILFDCTAVISKWFSFSIFAFTHTKSELFTWLAMVLCYSIITISKTE